MGLETAKQGATRNLYSEIEKRPAPKDARKREVSGLRIRYINAVIIALGIVIMVLFMHSTRRATRSYETLQEAIDRFAVAELAANDFKMASDNMTEQLRLFVFTEEPDFLYAYFREAFTRHRRENALETLQENVAGTEAESYLEQALQDSNKLMQIEYRCMKLIVEGRGYELTGDAERELDAWELSEEDRNLPPEEKLERGKALAFDARYQAYDERIDANVTGCMRRLDTLRQEAQEANSETLEQVVQSERTLAALLLCITLASIVSAIYLVLIPLGGYVRRITDYEPLPMKGAFELRYLAQAYNVMYEENQKNSAHLRHEAEHDPLTGLYNRGAFTKLRTEYQHSPSIALILVDVDKFKDVNDTYGHDVGDKVLVKVAKLLDHNFRSTDYPCRVGGDEFSVIMTDVTPEMKKLVRDKLRQVREGLIDVSDGLPRTTLSIGVAFGKKGRDAYKDADSALYQVKEHGRDGCAFFGEPYSAAEAGRPE